MFEIFNEISSPIHWAQVILEGVVHSFVFISVSGFLPDLPPGVVVIKTVFFVTIGPDESARSVDFNETFQCLTPFNYLQGIPLGSLSKIPCVLDRRHDDIFQAKEKKSLWRTL
jgi:hypothetical protein